jgi:hypothetical protein
MSELQAPYSCAGVLLLLWNALEESREYLARGIKSCDERVQYERKCLDTHDAYSQGLMKEVQLAGATQDTLIELWPIH